MRAPFPMRALSETGAHLAAITILMVVLLGILNAPARINHDNAMYLAMGEGLLRGEVPYVDLVDLNPPLIVYLNTIPAAAAKLLGIYPPLTFLVFVWLFSVWSVLATRRILAADPTNVSRADVVAAGMAAHTWFLWWLNPFNQFGQREHLFVLGFIPYLLLRCRRQSDTAVGPFQAAVVGLAAGVLACLKPHFVAVALAPELCWAVRRRGRAVLSIELIVFVAAGLVYAGHFVLLPEAMRAAWFERWIPLIASGYHAYGQPLSSLFARKYVWLPSTVGLVVLAATWRWRVWREFGVGLATAAAMTLLIIFVQQKGWHQQRIPGEAMTFLISGLAASAVIDWVYSRARGRILSAVSRAAAVGVIAVLTLQTAMAAARVIQPRSARAVEEILAGNPMARTMADRTRVGDRVLILSTSVLPTFPLLIQLGRLPGTRYMFAFPLPMLYAGAKGVPGHPFPYRLDDPRRAGEEARFREDLSEDIRAHRPKLIFVTPQCQACPDGFTLRDYLNAWDFVHTAMAGYREIEPIDGVQVYLRHDD